MEEVQQRLDQRAHVGSRVALGVSTELAQHGGRIFRVLLQQPAAVGRGVRRGAIHLRTKNQCRFEGALKIEATPCFLASRRECAKRWSAVSDGGEDQGAEEAV